MVKRRTHVRPYTRSRHGTADHGGVVSEHDRGYEAGSVVGSMKARLAELANPPPLEPVPFQATPFEPVELKPAGFAREEDVRFQALREEEPVVAEGEPVGGRVPVEPLLELPREELEGLLLQARASLVERGVSEDELDNLLNMQYALSVKLAEEGEM